MAPQNRPLEKIFNDITASYDRMNRLLTLGMDQRWRKKAVRILLESRPRRILDLCTGTGDFAFLIADAAMVGSTVTAIDYSRPMLDRAAEKAEVERRIQFLLGDAADLPFDDDSYDAIGISFAFRNLTYKNQNRNASLCEVRRVLRPGGIFVIVESSQPRFLPIRLLRDRYVDRMVARRAARISGHQPAYRYLADSVKRFYTPQEIEQLLNTHGFRSIKHHGLFFGAVAITTAT